MLLAAGHSDARIARPAVVTIARAPGIVSSTNVLGTVVPPVGWRRHARADVRGALVPLTRRCMDLPMVPARTCVGVAVMLGDRCDRGIDGCAVAPPAPRAASAATSSSIGASSAPDACGAALRRLRRRSCASSLARTFGSAVRAVYAASEASRMTINITCRQGESRRLLARRDSRAARGCCGRNRGHEVHRMRRVAR